MPWAAGMASSRPLWTKPKHNVALALVALSRSAFGGRRDGRRLEGLGADPVALAGLAVEQAAGHQPAERPGRRPWLQSRPFGHLGQGPGAQGDRRQGPQPVRLGQQGQQFPRSG